MTQNKPEYIKKPQNLSRNIAVVCDAINGNNQTQIAQKNGISQPTVSRILKDEQCQTILDHVMRVNIAHAKGINKKFLKLCYDDDKKISLDAIKQYQKNIGITPSHTQNQFILNILSQTTSIQFGPAVGAVLDSVIDVDPLPDSVSSEGK